MKNEDESSGSSEEDTQDAETEVNSDNEDTNIDDEENKTSAHNKKTDTKGKGSHRNQSQKKVEGAIENFFVSSKTNTQSTPTVDRSRSSSKQRTPPSLPQKDDTKKAK